MSRPEELVRQFSDAQTRIVGRFCSNCRLHRSPEHGRELRTAKGRTRWVCQWCARKYDEMRARK